MKNVGTKTKSTKKRQSGDDKLVSAPALLIEPTPSLGEISDQEAAVGKTVICFILLKYNSIRQIVGVFSCPKFQQIQ